MPSSPEDRATQEATGQAFEPGAVFRNLHVPKYTVTLIRPSGSLPGWWLVEPAKGQSHGKYVYSEQSLSEHFVREPRP